MSKLVRKVTIFFKEIKFLSKYFVFLRLHLSINLMKTFAKAFLTVILVALYPLPRVQAQNIADSLRKAYDFAGAIEFCESQIAATEDSLELEMWDTSLVLAQNGLSMTDYCLDPSVVARVCLPLKDFYLFYPMRPGTWHPVPNQLDPSDYDGLAQAVYIANGADEIFFSAPDSLTGFRHIYQTEFQDTLWSAPTSIYGMITEESNEIYPMLSPDGRTLFFASDGLYGMGGYDIYSSSWDDQSRSWSMPVNMGFPFSSPYDDFLYYDTPDGKYSIFASNRGTTRDSVYIYVLNYDSSPIRKSVDDIEQLRTLAALNPKATSSIDNTSLRSEVVNNPEIQEYSLQASLVKALRDTLYRFHDQIDVSEIQARLNDAMKSLQRLEMNFLSSGINFDLSSLQKESQRQVVGAQSGFTFSKNEPGGAFSLEFEQPEPQEEAPKETAQRTSSRRSRTVKPVEIVKYNLVITPANGRALSSAAIATVRRLTSYDIIRHSEDGVVTFKIGQFNTSEQVQVIIDALEQVGETNCSIQEETITVQP